MYLPHGVFEILTMSHLSEAQVELDEMGPVRKTVTIFVYPLPRFAKKAIQYGKEWFLYRLGKLFEVSR